MEPVTTVFNDIVTNVVEELRVIHPLREIRTALEADVRGDWDPGRLGQVVSNLVDNALQYGDRSRPVEVRLAWGAGAAILEVRSFGPAIPEDLIPVLFDPYRRGQTGGNRSKGLGLGLFISHQIVTAHRGRIEVESNAEDGTTFRVHLPRAVK